MIVGVVLAAALTAAPKSEVLGRWQGTSICTRIPGNESCHDEKVIYDFMNVPGAPDSVRLNAAKIVNGRPEPMGELDFRFDPAHRRWACEFTSRRGRGVWVLWIRGAALTGKLYLLPDSTIARNVSARKTSPR
jgi:hypothetical protein